jgi:microcystin degradation protein MlrC
MRVAIISIQHESNTFLPQPTDIAAFSRNGLPLGEKVREVYGPSHHEVGGFFEGLDAAGIEAVPIIAANATPGGALPAETLEHLLKLTFDGLDAAGKLDGILVAPHGAGVCEAHRDMDGYWLSLLRERVGKDMPIICTLDPHANLTRRMVDACNATIIYRTNPHLDQRARGLEAAALMARTLRGEVKPTQACALPPIAINIERQFTDDSPCRELLALADEIKTRPGVLSDSVVLCFPYSDVEEMGSGFVVVTDNDPALAQKYCDELAAYLHEHRALFAGEFIEIDEAIDMALATDGPVCLLDMGDNVGGGSAADGTFLAKRLHERKVKASFIALYDPQAAKQCFDAGLGAELTLSVGGKSDDMHGPPIEVHAMVEFLGDGHFEEPQARHGGRTQFNMGPTAIVRTDTGLTIQLTSQRTPPFSLNQVRSCDIDPASMKILVAKGVNAPVAAYREVCVKSIRVNTPGSTCADMRKFDYKYRRRPLYPLEEI